MKITDFKKRKIKLLTKKQQGSYEMQKFVIFAKKNLKINICKIKNLVKLDIIVIIQGNMEFKI